MYVPVYNALNIRVSYLRICRMQLSSGLKILKSIRIDYIQTIRWSTISIISSIISIVATNILSSKQRIPVQGNIY